MIPLHEDPWFTFRFADDRIIPRFHLEGVETGRTVEVFRINPSSGERLGLLATATVGDGGWVRGDANDLKLTALKGRSVLDLELSAAGAKAKTAALVILAKAALAQL